jgi:Tol biopolymer transport system component
MVYEVAEGSLKNIYVAKIDGKNILQLTTDGQSGQPLFSPRSDEIAFLREADGIYLIGINKENVRKITNLKTEVRLLLWR